MHAHIECISIPQVTRLFLSVEVPKTSLGDEGRRLRPNEGKLTREEKFDVEHETCEDQHFHMQG